jgi:hypothetical protein
MNPCPFVEDDHVRGCLLGPLEKAGELDCVHELNGGIRIILKSVQILIDVPRMRMPSRCLPSASPGPHPNSPKSIPNLTPSPMSRSFGKSAFLRQPGSKQINSCMWLNLRNTPRNEASVPQVLPPLRLPNLADNDSSQLLDCPKYNAA